MAKRRHTAEQIIGKLREAEIAPPFRTPFSHTPSLSQHFIIHILVVRGRL